ncbi:MAG: response regulator transcription factor [Bacteroidetes bacterium]|jgi:DNA-binding LytR/AlgR family response regulator|nr:MAG: response regulator transcription factor [Bacteroidota bacterium]
MTVSCLIVDDEPLAQDILDSYVKKTPQLNLVGICSNAIEALEKMKHNQVDLIFLDIQMPEITGIDFLRSLKDPPMVIFTTAYQNYAVEGFELNAIDYLLKPFSQDRFLKAVRKAEELFVLKNEHSQREDDYIFIKSDQKLQKVSYNDILFVEALADYVKIHTPEKRYITLQTMKNMEEKLPERYFKRVHRSFIVALDKIITIVGGNVEINGQKIPIGKNYKEGFYDALKKNNILK